MYAVNVRFYDAFNKDTLKGKEYYYLSHEDVPVGDVVVVDTRSGFALAQVTSIPSAAPDIPKEALKTIVCSVDFNTWNIREIGRIAASLP